MPVRIIRRSSIPVQQAIPAVPAPSPVVPPVRKGGITIRKRPAASIQAPQAPAADTKAPTPSPFPVLPAVAPEGGGVAYAAHPRGWAVGGGLVLKANDFNQEDGMAKFLLHKVKYKVWYRILRYDPEARLLGLLSQTKMDFDNRVHATLPMNYVVAALPAGTEEPPLDMLVFVNRKLPDLVAQLQSTATAA